MLLDILYIIFLICLFPCAVYTYAYVIALFKKESYVRSITSTTPRKRGDVSLANGVISIKNIRIQNFSVSDIVLIEGRSDVTVGVEEVCCVDITFASGNKLLFAGHNIEHQQFLDDLFVRHLMLPPISWRSDFCPFSFDGQVLYRQ